MSLSDRSNFAKQHEILKKRISKMLLKENSKGLNSHENLVKQMAIKQYYALNHHSHK